jgi:hypothetical protein
MNKPEDYMPVGLVDDKDFEKELERLQGKVVPSVHKGRAEGDKNVPESLRKVIGETAVIDGRGAALDLASQFGISPSSVSAYAKGATSTTSYDTPSKSLLGHINKSRQRAISRAQKTLNGALSAISQEKLDYTDAKDLSGIAKDMSVIIRNLEPQQVAGSMTTNETKQFVIYAPMFKEEKSFDSIVVNE